MAKREDLGLPEPEEIVVAQQVWHILADALLETREAKALAAFVGFGDYTVKISDGVAHYVDGKWGHRKHKSSD